MATTEATTFPRGPMIAITALRILVGWHFFYEGLTKLTAPSWSAAGFLKQAKGPLAGSFMVPDCGGSVQPFCDRRIHNYAG